MRQRVRINESQLNRIINETVKKVVNEGAWNHIKGGYKGMVNGFNDGYNQMQSDDMENRTNENSASKLTNIIYSAFQYLDRADLNNPESMRFVIKNVRSTLLKSLNNYGYQGRLGSAYNPKGLPNV